MVRIETLMKEGKISRIKELEIGRYIIFFENSYKDNLEHSRKNAKDFPRWSIISGYYAMHDISKLYMAKKFRLKIDKEVHATVIKTLREVIKNSKLSELIESGYKEFVSLADDLSEAKKERIKAQYYTGTVFMKEEFRRRSEEFLREIAEPYIEKMEKLLGDEK